VQTTVIVRRTPGTAPFAAPTLGQHTDEVLASLAPPPAS